MSLLFTVLLAAQDAGVQKVVASIAQAARENAAREEDARVAGDALADLYFRRACSSGQSAKAIVLGLSYALDPSGVVARNPLALDFFEEVESAADRKARLEEMGKPTLRGREDWLAHFVLSAGLVVVAGEPLAEAIGIQKEISDAMRKEDGAGSGFSFTDLNADFAGIAFARFLTGATSKDAVAICGESFEGANYLPDPTGLVDGLTWTEFEETWGGVKDSRFTHERERLRTRAQGALALLRKC